MNFLSLVAWFLVIGLLGSIVYGGFSYILHKIGKGVLVSDEDGAGLKEALLDIGRAQDPSGIKEMELKALYNYPKYRDVILEFVEAKKTPQHSLALLARFKRVRRWWLSAFILYYALTSLAFVPAFMDCGFHNVPALGKLLGMLLGNIISAAIVYHCAIRGAGTRLLTVILFFLPLYVLGVCILVGAQPLFLEGATFDWVSVKNFIVEVCLPMLVIFSPIIFYWVTSLYLLKINHAMAKFRKLENVKTLLQL
jgi:hypothetical protein